MHGPEQCILDSESRFHDSLVANKIEKKMTWYRTTRTTTALRKTVLRVDLHVHVGDEPDFSNANDLKSAIVSVLVAAISKGLDVIGIVAHTGPNIGWTANQVASSGHYDICVVPGQEYVSADGVRMLVYNIKQPMPLNLESAQAITHAHKNGGVVMVSGISTAQANTLQKAHGTSHAPDAVEIYNAVKGEYRDVDLEYPKFISSAAKNANDLEKANTFTLIDRKELEKMHLIPEGVGEDYIPPYLNKTVNPLQNGRESQPGDSDDAPPAETKPAETKPAEANPPLRKQAPGRRQHPELFLKE